MFEQTFKNIDDVLWKEAGCTTELDYTEQTSWLLFLKYLDDLEHEKALEAELLGKSYTFILDEAHRWSFWAAPKKADGTLDHDNALIGDDLIDYVNRQLFPYLQGFKQRATSPDTIEYKIGEIFSEIKNRFQSGYSLRDALEYVDELRFRSQQEKHELSHLYEAKIKNMGNAGRNGGEYYTPPLPEQKRIVAILDEAFEGIDRAITNTEKNLANSRELFESYLNAIFTQKGDGWEKKTLQQISIKFARGKSKHRPRGDKKLYGGKYPLIQTGDISNAKHRITTYSHRRIII